MKTATQKKTMTKSAKAEQIRVRVAAFDAGDAGVPWSEVKAKMMADLKDI